MSIGYVQILHYYGGIPEAHLHQGKSINEIKFTSRQHIQLDENSRWNQHTAVRYRYLASGKHHFLSIKTI